MSHRNCSAHPWPDRCYPYRHADGQTYRDCDPPARQACTQEEHDAIVADDRRWLREMVGNPRMIVGDTELEARTCPRCGSTRTREVRRDDVLAMASVLRVMHAHDQQELDLGDGLVIGRMDLRETPSVCAMARAALGRIAALCRRCLGDGWTETTAMSMTDEPWPPQGYYRAVVCPRCHGCGMEMKQ